MAARSYWLGMESLNDDPRKLRGETNSVPTKLVCYLSQGISSVRPQERR